MLGKLSFQPLGIHHFSPLIPQPHPLTLPSELLNLTREAGKSQSLLSWLSFWLWAKTKDSTTLGSQASCKVTQESCKGPEK